MMVFDTCVQNGSTIEYKVSIFGNCRQYTVTVVTPNGIITCKNFEFVGILCSYALKVLDELKIKKWGFLNNIY